MINEYNFSNFLHQNSCFHTLWYEGFLLIFVKVNWQIFGFYTSLSHIWREQSVFSIIFSHFIYKWIQEINEQWKKSLVAALEWRNPLMKYLNCMIHTFAVVALYKKLTSLMHESQKSFIYVLRKLTPTNTSIIFPVIFTVYDFVICFKALNLLRKNMLPMNLITVYDT